MTPQFPQAEGRDDAAGLRRACGAWLREKREAARLSQREIASKVGIEYYTFISQIEAGRGRVPPERFEAYANGLGIDPRDFTMTMLRYNEPIIYDLLFANQKDVSAGREPSLTELEKRLASLEALLVTDQAR